MSRSTVRNNQDFVRDNFIISTDKSKLDLKVIHEFLTKCYWAEGIPISTVQKSINNALCFGVYDEKKQVGFARVISDFSTFAYLADVFILPEYRGRGLSKWLMKSIRSHPDLQGLRRWMLVTRDAHRLYEQYGFKPLANPLRIMEIHNPDVYKDSGKKMEALEP